MRRLSATIVFISLCMVEHSIGRGSFSNVLELNTELSLRLYQMLTQTENNSNLIVSPGSVTLSLGLLQLGARGNTLAQIQGIMGYEVSDPHILEALTQLQVDLGNTRLDVQVQLSNTLWVQNGVQLLPAFVQYAVGWYNSSVLNVNFSRGNHTELQQEAHGRGSHWVAAAGSDVMDSSVSGISSKAVVPHMALLSLVVFQGVWQRQFLLANTQNLPFTLSDGSTVKVPMMYQSAEVNFGEFFLSSELRYTVIELFYLDHFLSLLVVLPSDKKTPLFHLESQLTSHTLRLWDTGLRHTKMDIFLPRFKVHSRMDLKPILQSLGILDAFDPSSANFRGISDTESLYVSEAFHEARMEVMEGGTRAAAATAMILLKRSRAPVFKADRPFLFILRHINRGTVLFMGRVLNPAKQIQ